MIKTTSTTSFVAFLDILGFKEVIERNSQDHIVQLYESLQIGIEVAQTSNYQNSSRRKRYERVQSLVISDSIIFWTEDSSFNSFNELIAVLRWVYIIGFDCGLPFRGAISIGPIAEIYNNSRLNARKINFSLVGKGIVDAYLSEGSQNWSGCILSEQCISHFRKSPDEHARLKELITNAGVISYKVPFKSGPVVERYVLNWLPLIYVEDFEEKIIAAFKKHNKQWDNWDVQLKIANTLKFYKDTVNLLDGNQMHIDIEASNLHLHPKEVQISVLSFLGLVAKADLLKGGVKFFRGPYTTSGLKNSGK